MAKPPFKFWNKQWKFWDEVHKKLVLNTNIFKSLQNSFFSQNINKNRSNNEKVATFGDKIPQFATLMPFLLYFFMLRFCWVSFQNT